MIESSNTSVIYRSIQQHEHQLALDLWYNVFKCQAGFFERYFDSESSPCHETGDTFGAWIGNKLVSAVHIRRLRLRSRDDTIEYLCGAIANVATLEEFRRQGHSRELLRLAIQKMEENQFDLSILGTGVPNHYAALGWEQLYLPSQISIEWGHFSSTCDPQLWQTAENALNSQGETLLNIHSTKPRTYQFSRHPLSLFQRWIGWNWIKENAIICSLENNQIGYVVITNVDSQENIYVAEWRAPNIDIEKRLLKLAANEIRRRHPQIKKICFHTPPQYMSLEELEQWAGIVNFSKNDHTMIRNIRLPNEILEKIKAAYQGGHATFWQGDYF